ncbi:energy-coupling factor transporter ATPase, partial [Staphylococcus aureus]
TTGTVTVDDITITHKTKDKYIRPVRKRIGMVFQFPESQLFEDTVEREMIFGPKNFKMNLDEAKNYAHRLLMDLGFSRDVMSQSPFQMSGGQMRKIAIVSILAMNPDIIVVDEPTAGLDPQSKRQVMRLLKSLQTDENKAIILISHDMNEVARYADEVIVMKEGSIVSQTSPKELFKDKEKLADWHIGLPEIVQLQYDFEQKHQTKLKDIALTEEAFVSLYKEWQHEK